MSRNIYGSEIADGDALVVLWKTNFRAQIAHMYGAGVVVERAQIYRVLPREPRMTRRLKCNEENLAQ